MKTTIMISSNERKYLLMSLKDNVLYLDMLPQLRHLFPKTIQWYMFWSEILKEECKASIPIDRTTKIIILKAIQTGKFSVSGISSIAEKEEKRERFMELLMATDENEKR